MMTDKDSSAAGSKPITLFIRTRPAESKIHATLLGLNNTFLFVEKIIKEYTRQRPIHIQEACFEHTKKCFEDRVIPFLDMFKIHVMHCEKKNILIHDKNLIADCIAKDVCSIVLASEREVLLRSNCRCEELQSTYDREHSRVLELEAKIAEKQQMVAKSENQNSLIQKQFVDLQVKFQNYKECLRNQKEKDDTIRHLHAKKDILGLLNVGSTESNFEMKDLETEIAQLKEGLTSLKIHNDGYKVTNANLNKCYQELSKANTHLRTTSLEKIATQKAEIATLKVEVVGKKNSGPTGTPTKPKVLASGMYTKSSKYTPPQKRRDWVQPTLLPKKKRVAFLEPHRTSPKSTQKPPVQQKKPTVSVNMFPKAKPTTEARKPIPKRNTQNHNPLPAKSVKARRAADYYRNLYVDIIARIVPIWKPTGRRFNLHDIFGSRTSTEPIIKPSELTPCVSPSTNATLSLEPILELVELPRVLVLVLVRQSLWSLGSLTIDSAIARLVPMGYLASFTDEILVQSQGRTVADSYTETSKTRNTSS
nr:hypothetical protein [Tanacetum cinerariifolium]